IHDPQAPGQEANQRGGPTRGNAEAALASSAVRVEATFTTPIQTHHPMEMAGSIAAWNGEKLTVYEGSQAVLGARKSLADYFGLPTGDVTVVSPYVGGGFGARLRIWPHTHLAAAAARMVGRPVKLVLTRSQMGYCFGHRPQSHQQLTLGAQADGRLNAIVQNTITSTGAEGGFIEPVTGHSLFLWAHQASQMQARAVRLNVGPPAPMRAPGAPLGLFALEVAMDELAERCGIDPLELRLRNDTLIDPSSKRPYTDRHLAECLRRGAEMFGWAQRPLKPAERREGDWLIGQGLACCAWHGGNGEATARVRVLRDGSVVVAAAAQDMGTGTYTVMAQAAAEVLGVPIDKVTVELGISTLPPAPAAGGSRLCSSIVPAVHKAAESVRRKLLALAQERAEKSGTAVPEGSDPEKPLDLAGIVASSGESNIEATEQYRPDGREGFTAMNFGAHFCEVQVHRLTGEVRVRRFLGVFDCGRVFNPRTAGNQLLGGIVWGIGMALCEGAPLDSQCRFAGADLGGYHLPTHADVPDIQVEMINHPDENFGALGSRGGVGELGISGVAAAISNAIYNATGKRLRDCPFTPEKLL
ncbi:MAG: xanthine dehydrogenase family protein molybdopterin-binding subunit, partial [Phycisphaerae bacterium]|nr:xanthine dehydrogenase family protein molybdopterin-binding subunit [Phycisphaerae bacterium]